MERMNGVKTSLFGRGAIQLLGPELAGQALRDTCMASDQLEPTQEEAAAVYLAAYKG